MLLASFTPNRFSICINSSSELKESTEEADFDRSLDGNGVHWGVHGYSQSVLPHDWIISTNLSHWHKAPVGSWQLSGHLFPSPGWKKKITQNHAL